jgi:hypothetical protein
MKNRIHFKHRLDQIDAQGEIIEHLGGVDDFELADALYEAALKRWPKARRFGSKQELEDAVGGK